MKTAHKDKLHRLVRQLRSCQPRNRRQLAAYVRAFLNLNIPDKKICPDHHAPLDYLAHAFLDPHASDIVVWANRGGGKTQMGAVLSLLEGLFLPHCSIRILGGSEDQAQRMYNYLQTALHLGFSDHLQGRLSARGCRFRNHTDVQVLTQSDRSVRGQHVQRLRCDEVELFHRDIWQAAQFITRSTPDIRARLEVLSTMHRPYGLMHEIVSHTDNRNIRLFRWCLWEVIENCRDRECSRCPLWQDCQGRARQAHGFYRIDDALAQMRRSSRLAWQAEMLCQHPRRDDIVFAEFHPRTHVRDLTYDPDLPLYRAIDFGFSNPFACLFIQVDSRQNVRVLDEHLKARTTLAEHARLIKQRYPYPVAATYCDPAGRQQREVTGTSPVQELAACGIPTTSRASSILAGIELIRAFLQPAQGSPRLFIAPSCSRLIQALQQVRFARQGSALSELPAKDGVHDHVIDALRYFFVNHFGLSPALNTTKY